VLVILALVCDAFLGNFQERLFTVYKTTRTEVVQKILLKTGPFSSMIQIFMIVFFKIAFTYSIGCCLLLLWMLIVNFDELCEGILFLWKNFRIFVSIVVLQL
jgi:hypothetical protein